MLPSRKKTTATLRHFGRSGVVIVVALALASTAFVASAVDRGDVAETFEASFQTRAATDATVKPCRALPAVHKIEGRYTGAMTIGEHGQERALNFSLKILYDRATGVGDAKGTWQLIDPPDPDIVGAASGELIAVVAAAEATPPDPEVSPPDPDLQLHGLLTGTVNPPDPDLPAQQLIANFAGSITDGTLNFTGAVGDPTGLTPNPAALLPAVKC